VSGRTRYVRIPEGVIQLPITGKALTVWLTLALLRPGDEPFADRDAVVARAGLKRDEVEDALIELVACGIVYLDEAGGFWLVPPAVPQIESQPQ
jgi:hypothetical protein